MYKTIVLAFLQDRPAIHDQLRRSRTLLPTLNLYAAQLKTSHETWKGRLSQAKPGTAEGQIASEALEIALQELEDCLTSAFPQKESDPLSLDEAMAFIRGRTPRA